MLTPLPPGIVQPFQISSAGIVRSDQFETRLPLASRKVQAANGVILRGHGQGGTGEQRSRRVGAAAQGRGLHYVKVGNAVVLGAADVAFPAGISELKIKPL